MNYELRIKKNSLSFILVFLLFYIPSALSATTALAGEIKFFLNEANFLPDEFEIKAVLDSEEAINAIEGELVFLDNYAGLEAAQDGNSVINFWIKRPQATAGNRLEFAGIIPGGFKGGKGELFSMIFKSKRQLNAGEKISNFISAQKIRGFLNDDLPSAAKLAFSPFDLIVPPEAGQAKPKEYVLPENFKPEIGRDPLIFEGEYFLVFGTQDKDSGVNYYEVKEGERSFKRAESPYLLENQSLTELIFVRAADYAGNVREVALYPLKYQSGQIARSVILIGMASFAVLFALVFLGCLLLKHTRKYGRS